MALHCTGPIGDNQLPIAQENINIINMKNNNPSNGPGPFC